MYIKDKQMVENTILLKDKFGLNTIIETGTYTGESTQLLSTMFDKVYSCELFYDRYKQHYTELLKNDKVKLIQGSSADMLPSIFDEIGNDKFILYLDAHEYDSAPLRDELQIVADYGFKPVIIIHDWDMHIGPLTIEPYSYTICLEYLKDKMDLIYGEDGYIFETQGETDELPAVGYFYSK
jgi:hypothetical protein